MTGAESPDDLLTTYQAAALVGIAMDSVMHAIDRGTLPATTGTAGLSKRQRLPPEQSTPGYSRGYGRPRG